MSHRQDDPRRGNHRSDGHHRPALYTHSSRTTLHLALCLTLVLTPVLVHADTLLEDPTFAEGGFAALGSGIDVEGDFAVASSPGTRKLHFYVRSPDSGEWSSGITIDRSSYDAVGSPVALGDNLAIYYAVQPDFSSGMIEVHQLILGIPSSDTVVAYPLHFGLPHSLVVAGDLMVIAWRPDLQYGHGYVAYERTGEQWQEVFSAVIPFGTSTDSTPGWAVDTDGVRVVATNPGAGDQGRLEIWSRDGVGGWVQHSVLYSNPFQSDVRFGSAVAIDGGCIVTGMQLFDAGSFIVPGSRVIDSGGAQIYAFDPAAGGWVGRQALVPESPLENDQFGTAVALRGPNLVLAGEDAQRSNLTTPGDAAFFRLQGSCLTGSWSEVARLRSAPLVFDPDANGDFGATVGIGDHDVLIFDPLGPTGEEDGRGYAYPGLVRIFLDDFESGDSSAW